MPRFKFQWSNLPEGIQHALLPKDHQADQKTPETLKKLYGARPNDDFIHDHWPILIEHWLANDTASLDSLSSSLRSLGLGDTTIDSNLEYLRGCKNTKNLRSFALQAFLDFGEKTASRSPQLEAISEMLTVVTTTSPSNTNLSQSAGSTLILHGDPESELRNKARAAVGKLFNSPPEDVFVDSDGDVAVRFGSAAVYVRVVMANPIRYSIFSPLLSNVNESPSLYEILNEINKNLIIGSMTTSNSNVVLEYSIISTITMEELSMVIDYMTDVADQYDNKLQEYVGGEPFFREKNQDEVDV